MGIDSTLVHRLRNVTLENAQIKISLAWGEIRDHGGILKFKLFSAHADMLNTLDDERNQMDLYSQPLRLYAESEHGDLIEGYELYVDRVTFAHSCIDLTCDGYIKRTESRALKERHRKRPIIYFVEVEGLSMDHGEANEEFDPFPSATPLRERESWQRRRGLPSGMTRNHSKAQLHFRRRDLCPNSFPIVFYRKRNSENTILEFDYVKQGYPNVLFFDIYESFRIHLETFLSFLNGTDVRIKKEFIGNYVTLGHEDSETVITYSYRFNKTERQSNYLNIRDWRVTKNILSHLFMNCFEKFCEMDVELDMRSVTYYLNEAHQSRVINHKFFLLLIALERMAFLNLSSSTESGVTIIGWDEFTDIREAIADVINKSGVKNNEKLLNRIDNVNKLSRTEGKFVKLLQRAGISIDNDLNDILSKARNSGIHEGEVEGGLKGIYNYVLLDNTIRDIVLNLIDYDRSRNKQHLNDVKSQINEGESNSKSL